MLILVGNGPRTFREALGTMLGACRPMDRVLVVDPDKLASAVSSLAPEVVVCDPQFARTGVSTVWIQVDGTEPGSTAQDEGRQRSSLHEILETVERVARHGRRSP